MNNNNNVVYLQMINISRMVKMLNNEWPPKNENVVDQ